MFVGMELEARLIADAPERRERFVRLWAKGMLRALGVEVLGAPAPPPTPGRPRLVVANHRSTVDILVMLDAFGGHMLARGDMANWPVMGPLATAAGTLFVDRADKHSGAAAVKRMRELLARGRTMGVFPEGTTHAGDEVRPFHPGAFAAIARARGEVVPVGIAYDGDHAIFGDEEFGPHARRILEAAATRVAFVVGAPIVAGTDIGALRDRAHADVQSLVHRARARLDSSRR